MKDDKSTADGAAAESPVDSDADQNSSFSSSPASSTRRDIYAESSTSPHEQQRAVQDVESDVATTVDEIAYQKLRGSKETIYTKLKNRIRTLEDNLNLTNR